MRGFRHPPLPAVRIARQNGGRRRGDAFGHRRQRIDHPGRGPMGNQIPGIDRKLAEIAPALIAPAQRIGTQIVARHLESRSPATVADGALLAFPARALDGLLVMAQIRDDFAVGQDSRERQLANVADGKRNAHAGHDVARRVHQAGKRMPQAGIPDQRRLGLPFPPELVAIHGPDRFEQAMDGLHVRRQFLLAPARPALGRDHLEIRFDPLAAHPPPKPGKLFDVLPANHGAQRHPGGRRRIAGRAEIPIGFGHDGGRAGRSRQKILDLMVRRMPLQHDMHAQGEQPFRHRGGQVRPVGEHFDAHAAAPDPFAQSGREIVQHGFPPQQHDFPDSQRLALGNDVANLVDRQFGTPVRRVGMAIADIAIPAAEVAAGPDFDLHGQQSVPGPRFFNVLRGKFAAEQ